MQRHARIAIQSLFLRDDRGGNLNQIKNHRVITNRKRSVSLYLQLLNVSELGHPQNLSK